MLHTKTYKILVYTTILMIAAVVVYNFTLKEEYIIHRVKKERPGYDQPDRFVTYFRTITSPYGTQKSGYNINHTYREFQDAVKYRLMAFGAGEKLDWVSRGPGNVGGRTRSVLVDPDDPTHNTWFAGAVSGGIWKTTDAGQTWENLTPGLSNLSTNTLAMAMSNTNIMYAGTGEGYGGVGMVAGNGVFKSVDKGQSWDLLISSIQDDKFEYVNKIIVDPATDSIVIAATNKGIYKSTDGGDSWNEVYNSGHMVQDLAPNPDNFNTIYAGVNFLGIIKSTDAGNTWKNSFEGIGTAGRFSVDVSPVDTSVLFSGAEVGSSTTVIYMSSDAGETWSRHLDSDGSFIQFFQAQGWFNNVVRAHPYDENKVFIGGVYLGEVEFKRNTSLSDPTVVRVDTNETGSFMKFFSYGAPYFEGTLSTGLSEDSETTDEDDMRSVQIRFGPGIGQKAHRFTVPYGEGAGVPDEDYAYQNYIDIPFEAWDVEENRQLMISFRDQEREGEFNLVEREYDNDTLGREYFFIHNVDYDPANPDPNIAVAGGHMYKMIYFMWPTLPDEGEWDPENLPVASIDIKYDAYVLQDVETTVLADDRKNDELHVDHHDIVIIKTNEAEEEFMMVIANDGGLGLSYDKGNTWSQIKNGYVTTQFYGVAKHPFAHEYIGGMQDNGTWQSPVSEEASAASEYSDRIAGDGFEALWHPWYPQRIIGSSYENIFRVTNNYGEDWSSASGGISYGPFVSRLSHSRKNPNLIFAVGGKGVYRHRNFGLGRYDWELTDIGDGWTVNNLVLDAHNVEVSLADPSVVYAGAGFMKEPDFTMFVSHDYGESFDSMAMYTDREMGFISGLATHPANPAEAFLIFSLKDKPKILRTYDYGQTWEDISGFGLDSSSSNGFPDVMVYSLLVMPHDTNVIWAGTEIGLFESVDNGETWLYADNGLPAVSIWQIEVVGNTIVVATHGRGIWTLEEEITPVRDEAVKDASLSIYPNPATDVVHLKYTSSDPGDIEVKILDLSGKEVYGTTFSVNSSGIQKEIDIRHLSAGIYILQIDNQKELTSKKLIVK